MPSMRLHNTDKIRIEPSNYDGDNWIDVIGDKSLIMAQAYNLQNNVIIIKRKEAEIRMFVYENEKWLNEFPNEYWDSAEIIYDSRATKSS